MNKLILNTLSHIFDIRRLIYRNNPIQKNYNKLILFVIIFFFFITFPAIQVISLFHSLLIILLLLKLIKNHFRVH